MCSIGTCSEIFAEVSFSVKYGLVDNMLFEFMQPCRMRRRSPSTIPSITVSLGSWLSAPGSARFESVASHEAGRMKIGMCFLAVLPVTASCYCFTMLCDVSYVAVFFLSVWLFCD